MKRTNIKKKEWTPRKKRRMVKLKKVDPFYYYLTQVIAKEAKLQRKAKKENPELYQDLVKTQFERIKAKLKRKKNELGIKHTGIDVE